MSSKATRVRRGRRAIPGAVAVEVRGEGAGERGFTRAGKTARAQ